MCDWFLLLDLQVQQARSNARAFAYPATSYARQRIREFAVAVGHAVPSLAQAQALTGPPSIQPTKTYAQLDQERRLCEHRLPGPSRASACKKYGAAGKTWSICNLCQRRWVQKGDQWEVYDREQVERSRASSSRSAPTSSGPTPTTTVSSRRARMQRSPASPDPWTTSPTEVPPPTEDWMSDLNDSPSEFEFLP